MLASAGMEFRILGPLELENDGALLDLGPEKQRALLAMLLLDANHTVSVERLADGLWGARPPANATKAVQTYVARLRKALPSGTLRTRPPGYVVEVEADRLDLVRFERALAEGRRALGDGRPMHAASTLREALDLWRGQALTEFASEPFAVAEAARLEELRMLALEERIEADLALGSHSDLVGELDALVERHPFRERFRRQLMLALYRSGRQAEALTAYRDARRYFVDELGIEPSRSLHDLESAILRQDTTLDVRIPDDEAATWQAAASGPAFGVFVGREHELDRLGAALGDALGGRGRLVVLSGEQGIGKTRIAMEVAARAGRMGARVCWGRCYEREGAPPYWPWVQVIRACAEWCGAETLRAELPRQAAIVAGVVPELGDRLAGLPPPSSLTDPKEARFRFFDATATFLTHAARDTSLVVVLDDLHASDAESLLLLEVLARELADSHLLVIGTFRDVGIGRRHPLADTLAELSRESLFERLAVRGLSDLEVSRFIEASVGDTPPSSLARAVHEKAEGNPLFMTEVVRLLVQEQGDHDVTAAPAWGIRVPESVREVIGRRLDALSPGCNDLLRIASVVGREFDMHQLRLLLDEPSGKAMLLALDEAAVSHVVEEIPDTPGRYRFTHGLVQETLTDELSTTQRIRLHCRVLEALESLYAADVEAHAAELVRHAAEAEAVLGPDRLVRYARIAGDDALAAHSYDSAHAYFRQALDAKGRVLDDDTAWLHFGLARCEFATRERYDLSDALEHMRVAFTHFLESGDERSAVEIAVHPVPYVYGSPEAADVATRALDLVPPASREAGHLLSTLGWFSGMRDYERSRDAFQRSHGIAATLGDRALERKLLVSEAHVDFWHLRFRDCMEKAAKSIALAREAGDEHTELAALSEASRMCVALGDPSGARAHTGRMLELADRFHERYWLVTARVNRLWLTALTGDWEEALTLSDEAFELQRRDARNLGLRAIVEATLGDDAGARDQLERLLRARGLSARGFPFEDACVVAFFPIVEGLIGHDERRDHAEEAARTVEATGHIVPFLRLYVTVGRSLEAVHRGDATLARLAYDELLPLAGTYPPLLGVSADRLLGSLARAAGTPGLALEHLECGLDGCRDAGYLAEYAWTAWQAAAALAELGGAANRVRSVELRAEAIAVASGLGMSRPSDGVEP